MRNHFSRNVCTDTPQAFAQDALALALAQELVASGQDRSLPLAQRSFAYMPYMHSESTLVHAQAVVLFDPPGMEDTWRFELRHQVIIERFGRYPHHNAILGRESTPEELAFLENPHPALDGQSPRTALEDEYTALSVSAIGALTCTHQAQIGYIPTQFGYFPQLFTHDHPAHHHPLCPARTVWPRP